MKVINSRLKARLIIICILIGTIPAVMVGVFSYSKASDTIQSKVDDGNMQILQQVKMSTEQLLYISDHVMLQLVESPIIKSSLSVDMDGSNFETFNDVETVINNLPTSDIGTKSICLANFTKDWVITYNGIYRLNDFERTEEFREYLKMDGSSFWVDSMSLKGNTSAIPEKTVNYVSIIKKSPVFLTNPDSIVVMSIPYSRLSELVADSRGLGRVMVIGKDGCVVAHNDINMTGKDISNQEYFKKANNMVELSGNYTIPINGDEYSVNYLKSEYNGWIYISVTSLNSVTKDSKTIGWFTFFACLGVIIMINIAAFFISNRIYMPIGKLYNLVLGLPDLSETIKKKDELVLIEDRVNYLLKNQVKLKKQVYNQFEQLKEFFILKLLLSEMDNSYIESRVKLYDFPPMPDYACVWVISIDTLEGTQYTENDKDLMLFAINNIIGELLEENMILKPVVIDKYQVTIVGGFNLQKEQYKDQAYTMAKRVQAVVSRALDFSISIGISKPLKRYCEFNRGYLQAIEALKHQLLLGYNAIIFLDDVHKGTITKPVFPSELENDLLSAVKLCDRSKALELLHQFVERIFKKDISRYEYQISVTRLATDLIFLLREAGESYDPHIKDGQSVYERLFQLKTVHEIENWFARQLIEPIVCRLETAGANQFKSISDEILRIIREEYDRNLTLEECAVRMNYHPSYIRRILKREAGISFSDYLGQYRMDIAKKWLTETDMKVSEIAEKLRYKNPENFIRGFRKVTGITPGMYREQNNSH